jgi:DtxR family Mn-dependent transcriptional regulator
MKKELSSTMEDYLEAIYRIEKKNRAARVRDISRYVGVTKSTVSAALKSLAGKQLLEYEPYELIVLTPKGREKALTIVLNHHIISHFLQSVLALGRQRAERIACELEHAVDREVMKRFACFLAFVKNFGVQGTDLLEEFRRFLSEGSEDRICEELIAGYREKIESELGPQIVLDASSNL